MKRLLNTFKLFIFFIVIMSSAKSLASEKSLTFCYENWLPFAYSDSNGVAQGRYIDFLRNSLITYRDRLAFTELPFTRCVKQVRTGDFDFILTVDDNDGFELINYPIGIWELAMVYQAESRWEIDNSSNSKGKRVLIAQNYIYPKAIVDLLENSQVLILKHSYYTSSDDDVKHLFKLLETGFVDAMLVDRAWAQHEIQRLNLKLKLADNVLYSQPQFIGYIESNSQKAHLVSQALHGVDTK